MKLQWLKAIENIQILFLYQNSILPKKYSLHIVFCIFIIKIQDFMLRKIGKYLYSGSAKNRW